MFTFPKPVPALGVYGTLMLRCLSDLRALPRQLTVLGDLTIAACPNLIPVAIPIDPLFIKLMAAMIDKTVPRFDILKGIRMGWEEDKLAMEFSVDQLRDACRVVLDGAAVHLLREELEILSQK